MPGQSFECLVVIGSSLTALALVRSSHNLGIACEIIDTDAGVATYSRYPAKHIVGRIDDTEMVSRLLELAQHRSAALISDSDRWLRLISENYEELSAAYTTILHPPPDVLNVCLNKSEFSAWCTRHNISTPRRYALAGAAIEISDNAYPVVLRPESTMHNIPQGIPKAVVVSSTEELEKWLVEYSRAGAVPMISQSLLRPNIQQYSIGVVCNQNGEMQFSTAEKIRSRPHQCAGGTYVVLANHEPSRSLAEAAITALNYFGIAECEILYDPDTDEAFLLEINARPWLQLGLTERSGGGFMRCLAYGSADAEDIDRGDRRWLHFSADAFVTLSATTGLVRQGNLGWVEYLGSLLSANSFAAWDIRDLRPFFHLTGEFVTRVLLKR